MEKRIKLEQRGRPENEIKELTLDNCRSPNIAGLTEEFTALETLSLINVGLTNLKGFPKLPTLKRLELSDNRISNGLHHLKGSPKLTHLNLCGNKIKDYADLEPLKSFSNLEALDLFNNEVTNASDYREKIFSMIPSLKYLDGFDCNDVEAASSEGEGEDDNFEDSDDEGTIAMNGIDINLKEFEIYEKKIQEKREKEGFSLVNGDHTSHLDEPDDLDEYLKELNLNKKTEESVVPPVKPNIPFPLLMLAISAILFLINYVNIREGGDSEEDDAYEEEDVDVPLSEVYNEDFEEDNSDWNETADVDDDEEEDEVSNGSSASEEDEKEEEENEVATESPARGKKRKHDG